MDGKTITLSDGHKIPVIGIGTWQSNRSDVKESIKSAIRCGYRHIDTAMAYENHLEISEGIHECIQEGLVKREDLYIVTKLWMSFCKRERVMKAARRCLVELKLDYIDLFLIHWPVVFKDSDSTTPVKGSTGQLDFDEVDPLETWNGMEDVKEAGLARSIGVSNHNSEQVKRIVDNCKYKPTINQVEIHPFLNQEKLVNFCWDLGIHLTAYSPLSAINGPWHKDGDPTVYDNATIKSIAEKHGKTPAQVALKFGIQRGLIVIPKSTNEKRIQENYQVFDFHLTDDEMKSMLSLDCGYRAYVVDIFKAHPEYPFNIPF